MTKNQTISLPGQPTKIPIGEWIQLSHETMVRWKLDAESCQCDYIYKTREQSVIYCTLGKGHDGAHCIGC